MALIVEDGTGKSNAESFCSVAYAGAYHSARGNDAWDDAENQEALLRKATDYMQAAYAGNWKGVRLTAAQALDWPRVGVVVDGYEVAALPADIAKACAELALRAASGDLVPDVGAQVVSETVGPIITTYALGARQTTAFKAVDQLLARYLSGGANSVPVARA